MTTNEDLRDELEEALDDLDEEDIQGLVEMIDESPELLRQALEEFGYKIEGSGDNDEFLVNQDAQGLSNAQVELKSALEGELSDPPKTVQQIIDKVGSEGASFRQEYKSAQYESWVSEQLKALVEAGEIGRYREGRSVYYTETPELAIRHWARVNGRFPDSLSVSDAPKISNDTGIPTRIVRETLRSIKNG